MNEVASVVLQCILSGAVLSSLCAAIVIPPLAWLGVRILGPTIVAMHDDRPRQAGAAAFAAAMPGALFLILVSIGLAVGPKSPCLEMPAGKVLYALLLGLTLFTIVRALMRARMRRRELATLLEGALPAQGRAAAIARAVGVTLYELPENRRCSVFVAKAPHLAVYISSFALRHFSEAELTAALHHERAHIARNDHSIALWLSFLTDLVPFHVGDIVDVYRLSREFCADENAIVHVDRTTLASALLCVARGGALHAPIGTLAFAEREAILGRLDVLLRPGCDPSENRWRRTYVTAALALMFALGVAAPILSEFFFACTTSRFMG